MQGMHLRPLFLSAGSLAVLWLCYGCIPMPPCLHAHAQAGAGLRSLPPKILCSRTPPVPVLLRLNGSAKEQTVESYKLLCGVEGGRGGSAAAAPPLP